MSDEHGQRGFEEDQATIAFVAQALPRVTPPDDMFDRILAEIRPEATVVPLPTEERIVASSFRSSERSPPSRRSC